jgi:dihydrolipoamide dehydrogenase
MLHASETFWHIRHAGEYGISVENPKIDAQAYMQRTAKVVSSLRNGVGFLLKKRKVDVINGRGTIVAPGTIDVETPKGVQQVAAKAIIIATGGQPVRPGFLPWDCPHLMTTDEATTATDLPKSVLVLGGGVIGCEFATVYSELGIPTTIVEMLNNLVDNLDSDISKAVTESLKKRDVNIITGTKLVSVKQTQTGVVAELEDGRKIEAAKMLVSIGRKPNTQNIGLEKLGVKMEKGLVVVDNNCRTSVAGIYAIGDIAETRQYAHLASRMGVVAADHATGHHAAGDDRTVVPTGIYTHPEAATVGLSEAQAKQRHGNIRVARFPYSASGMAQAYGQTEGLVKLIADVELGSILGAVVIGPHATDIIQEIAVAMRSELTIEEIAETIHPHPTFTEAVGEAAEAWLGLPLHTI